MPNNFDFLPKDSMKDLDEGTIEELKKDSVKNEKKKKNQLKYLYIFIAIGFILSAIALYYFSEVTVSFFALIFCFLIIGAYLSIKLQ